MANFVNMRKDENRYMTKKTNRLPLLPLRGLTVFPGTVVHFDVGRVKSKAAVDKAMKGDRLVLLFYQPDILVEEPKKEDLSRVGTLAEIKQTLVLPDGNMRILVDGICRIKLTRYYDGDDCRMACYTELHDITDASGIDTIYEKALMKRVEDLLEEYIDLYDKVTPETMLALSDIDDGGMLADIAASNFPIRPQQKQEILEELNVVKRLETLISMMQEEMQILEIERGVAAKLGSAIDRNQREYVLREQMKILQDELGDIDPDSNDSDKLRNEINRRNLPKEVKDKLSEELSRMEKQPPMSQEYAVIQNYIETVLALPWDKKSEENLDIEKAREILDRDHYGLEKVKERILEYLAVKKLGGEGSSSIICLAGPPGTGKTSIAKSLAEALGRKYVRISLGGIQSEAEIRGHRKTYIGSMPGRIMAAMKTAGVSNPLILLDEIDKMASDYKGDPASAMLEVLDKEQNNSFRDHFIELPFDLSDTMFITTANSYDGIPLPLLDRMDVIEISGYTEDEKVNIAKKYLIPKQKRQNGIDAKALKISDKMIREIIDGYTRESGVRNLERNIAALCRKTALDIISGKAESVTVSEKVLTKYLGARTYLKESKTKENQVGTVTGLAWTIHGGETLTVEASTMAGSGKVELTGNLGDVMKESAKAAMTYVRANCKNFRIPDDFYKTKDIHVHIPEGAVPKDGPSAGVTMATAMVSALSGIPTRCDTAMTGEITLRGRVLPIGGLKEKSLAAYRIGIKNIIIPYENKKDYEELPEKIKDGMNFVFAKDMETVLKNALAN